MSTWVVASSIVSPLGYSSEENYKNVRQNVSGLTAINDASLSSNSIFAGYLSSLKSTGNISRFEQMCQQAFDEAVGNLSLNSARTIYILSTTKGNISQLESNLPEKRLTLHATAKWLAEKAGFENSLVVSNACISGVMAIIVAKRFLDAGKYDHAVIVGSDELSKFIVSGFESLHALSSAPCKPFDVARIGINLGEAAAALILSSKPDELGMAPSIKITGGGLSNDANHISGPSRTGNELSIAIQQALREAHKTSAQIDFISAHGTATIFNDEMEAKAFYQSGLSETPLHSLKGYFGHTLGAAGIVESIISIKSLQRNEIPVSRGFENLGVTCPVNVSKEPILKPLRACLKTASGFGGCNAAIVIEKEIA